MKLTQLIVPETYIALLVGFVYCRDLKPGQRTYFCAGTNPPIALSRWIILVVGVLFLFCGRLTTATPADSAVGRSSVASPEASGLLAWWKFNEGGGAQVKDSSGNGLTGVIHGPARWVDGFSGKALAFDGQAVVEIDDPRLLLRGPFTIEAVFNPENYSSNSYKHIVELWDSYLLRLDNPIEGNKLSFFTFLDGKPEPRLQAGVPELSKWHQVVAVWDGAKTILWLDGVKAEMARSGQPAPKAGRLRIGPNFVGAIDEVKIYRRALTDEEVWPLFPPKLSLTVKVPHPVFETGQDISMTCEVANTGGRPLPEGAVELQLPPGLNLAVGERVIPVSGVSRKAPQLLTWRFKASAALAGEIKVTANFPGMPPVMKLAKVVVAKPIPQEGGFFDRPAVANLGNHLVLGNQHLRLVFPTNDFGYGVMAVDVNQSNRWVRLAVSPALSFLAVQNGQDIQRHFLYAREYATTRLDSGAWQLTFRRTLEDGAGAHWQCRFSFSLAHDDRVKLEYEAVPDHEGGLILFQGPTLHAGEGSFGVNKADGLFCGLEWLVGKEASSSNLDMHDPDYYLRYVPHPNKITIPLMAISQGSAALGLFWDCRQKWDGTHDRPAAVFASPNFLDGQNNHLLGLFLPPAPNWTRTNQLDATGTPYPFQKNVPLQLEAWLAVVAPAAQAMACVPHWFKTFGVPEPAPLPRGSYVKEIEFSARAFFESLWVDSEQVWWTSKGAGDLLSTKGRPVHYPAQLRMAALMIPDTALKQRYLDRAVLAEKLGGFQSAWEDLGFTWGNPAAGLANLRQTAFANLSSMGEDGAWRFRTRIETNGVFQGMDYARLGPDQAAELGTCAQRAYQILHFARLTGDATVYKAAEPALAFMRQFTVPRAAQVWECPVHSPDILAAADAMDAFLEAYRFSGDRRHLQEAVRWAWAGLPFIYVWNPPGKPILRYASIAIFGGSWFNGSWIGQPVQWNGLRYAYSLLKLADYDTSFPWRRVAEGITISTFYQQEESGPNVALWPDNFSAIDWSKCPWVFEPSLIMKNVYKLLNHDIEPGTTLVGNEPDKISVTARGKITQAAWQTDTLKFSLQFPDRESGYVMVAGLHKPAQLRCNSALLPPAPANLWQATNDGWQYLNSEGLLFIRLSTTGPHAIEIADAKHRTGNAFPKLAKTVSFDFNQDLEGWVVASQVEHLRVENGMMKGSATGWDPYMHRLRLKINGHPSDRIRIKARATAGSGLALFWITSESPTWAEDKVIRLPLRAGADFREHIFAVGDHPLWQGKTIIGLRLDPIEGAAAGEFEVDYIHGP